MKANLPLNEAARLEALRQYQILDTLPEREYDDIAILAAQICGTPIAMISLIDRDRQWIKSSINLDLTESSRDIAFCAHAIVEPDELFIVTNAVRDERFVDNPLVTSAPQIRFYAGAPLVTKEGEAIGTLCVIDQEPRTLTEEQKNALRALSRQVMTHLELRRKIVDLERAAAARKRLEAVLRESENRFHAFMSHTPTVAFMKDALGRYVYINEMMERTFQIRRDLLIGKTDYDWLPEEVADQVTLNDQEVLETDRSLERLETVASPTGASQWLSLKFPFIDYNGQKLVGGVAVDITARTAAEEQLKESEERYRHLFENSLGLICTHDLNGKILSLNGAAANALRREPDEITGTNLRDVLNPSVRESFDQYLQRIRAYKSDEGLMYVVTSKGEERTWKYHNLVKREPGEEAVVYGYAQDITELREAQDRLRSLSLTDDLTNLYNRRGFITYAGQALKVARRAGRECLLMFGDLDGLKKVNDTLGHERGSQMIQDTAKILHQVFIRETDVLARLGGDEFVTFMTDTKLEDQEAVKKRLQTAVDDFNRTQTDNYAYQISISIGFARYHSQAGSTIEDLMREADEAMYVDKQSKKRAA